MDQCEHQFGEEKGWVNYRTDWQHRFGRQCKNCFVYDFELEANQLK